MRAVLLAIISVILLPYCFLEPRFGTLVWLWFALMNPHKYVWGALSSIPFSKLIAVATIAGALINGRLKVPLQREIFLIVILWIIFTLTSFGALEPELAWSKWNEVSKIFLMVVLSVSLEWNRKWIYSIIAVMAFSIGLIGIKGAVFALKTGGEFMVYGPEDTFLADNTAIAIALDMSLPLFLILARDEQSSASFKMMCYVAVACSGLAALATYSRGGVLGLIVVVGLLLIKSQYKIVAGALTAIAFVFVLWFLPEKWFGRMDTIQNYEQERSAMSRMTTWKVLWQFALDHPIAGGGFLLYSRKISDQYLYKALPPDDADRYVGLAQSAHSIWVSVLAEHGFIALFLYAALFVSTFMSLRWLRRLAPGYPSLAWMENYASLLSVSLWGFVVAGTFLDFAYFDLFFHIVGIVIVLKILADRELAAASATRKLPVGYPILSADWAHAQYAPKTRSAIGPV
jgi:putative inorganic carbon (HCO3(-)) transporter